MAGKMPRTAATELQEKLEFLLKEEARLADPAQKFSTRKLIEETTEKLREHRATPPPASPPRDAESERQARKLEELYERKMDLSLTGKDVTAITEQIKDVRRLLHRGPVLRPVDFLADGRFKLGQIAGQGGFATVWQAADRDDGRIVGLKVLHAHHGQDLSRRERFFRGAREMADLRHQHIVAVLEKKHEDEGWHFFVMEYVNGRNFEEAILAGRLTRTEQLTVLQQACEALAFAHGRGVVHRDVKPSNILITSDGVAKLTDFDLVRADDSTGFTATYAMLGTLQFAAPEALHTAADADVRADVYSLASTAVFALSDGRLPATYYRDPAQVIAGLLIEDDLRQMLTQATAFERQKRVATVEKLCEALARVWPEVSREERKSRSQPETTEGDGTREERPPAHQGNDIETGPAKPQAGFWKWRPVVLGAVFGLLIILGILLFSIKLGVFSINEPQANVTVVVEMVSTLAEQRWVEPKLSGGTAYGPRIDDCDPGRLLCEPRFSPSSSPEPGRHNTTDLVSSWLEAATEGSAEKHAEALLAIVHPEGTPGRRWASAEKAVQMLETLAQEHPLDVRIHSDLAAAFFVRAQRGERPVDLVRALEAAEEAVALDSQWPDARFNQALAHEALALRPTARQAWGRYTDLDPSSPWAEEARQRREDLDVPEESWAHVKEQLDEAILQEDIATVRSLVASRRRAARR